MEKKRRMTRENAKKIVSKTGAGAKKAGAGAVKIAGAPGRKMKMKMGTLNDRMMAVKWTPKKMINEYIKFNIVGTVSYTHLTLPTKRIV